VPVVISPRRRIHVLVISHVGLYREGICRLLDEEQGLAVVGAASSCDDALVMRGAEAPDVALIDAGLPASLDAIRAVRERWAECRVIVVSVSDVEGDVLRFAEAGVTGYVTREGCRSDLVAAIESVERGEAACPPRAAAALLRRVAGLATAPRPAEGCLTAREAEILRLIDEGLSNKDIATRLFIGVPTVKTHVHNILRKLGASRRGQAAARVRFGV
jgi:two-component system, NarL family, nitrate/nitrite response regulator NarL